MADPMMIEIDGRHGEGGGQILRTALALAMVTGKPFRLTGIRENRPKPGLAAQHLTAVRAAATLCDAKVFGDALRSTELTFEPRRPALPGDYTFDVADSVRGGTAGSVSLLMQALLPGLALARGVSHLTLRGGTHVLWSPPFDCVADVWLPLLTRTGIRADVALNSWGWYPAGGGEIVCTIEGNGGGSLRPVELMDRGPLQRVFGRAVAANLPAHIPDRMASRARTLLEDLPVATEIVPVCVQAACAGAGIFLTAEYAQVRAGFSSLGERGKPSEQVAEEAILALREHHRAGGALDPYLADQVLLPLALAGGESRFSTDVVSGHLRANAWVIEQFGAATVEFRTLPSDTAEVTVRPISRLSRNSWWVVPATTPPTGVDVGESAGPSSVSQPAEQSIAADMPAPAPRQTGSRVDLFLCGDVMTGRGIDQILPHPSEPAIYEWSANSAVAYVELAEQFNGAIPRPVDFGYIWGDALAELQARSPHIRLINLETSVTTSPTPFPKGINYRMHPANVPCLSAALVDCCVLANNHVLDWGVPGLLETLAALRSAGIAVAGAGRNGEEAGQPAVLELPGGRRLLVFALGSPTSGIPDGWEAREDRPGVRLLRDLSEETARRIAGEIRNHKRDGDLAVASIHWGGNWGYGIPGAQRTFAHHLIDSGCVDLVHGHSSHHAKGIEVYEGRLILYGCGDFIDDYEGIRGYEEFRADLVLAYFVRLDGDTGRLISLDMVPFRSRRFRLQRAVAEDAAWLHKALNRDGSQLGTRVELTADGVLCLSW